MLAFLVATFLPSSHLLVKFCGLHLNYSNRHLEDILLTRWTWEKYPIINSILNGFFCHTLAKYSLSTLPSLNLYSFFLLLPSSFSSEACKRTHYPFHCDTIFLLPFFSQFWFLCAFLIFFFLLLLKSTSVLSLFFFFCFFNYH